MIHASGKQSKNEKQDSYCIRKLYKNCQIINQFWLLSLLFIFMCQMHIFEATFAQDTRLEEPQSNSSQIILARSRALPAENILLDDGSTTFVSSLEDFLSSTLDESDAETNQSIVSTEAPTSIKNINISNSSNNKSKTLRPVFDNKESEFKDYNNGRRIEAQNSTNISPQSPKQSAQLFQIERMNEDSPWMYDISTRITSTTNTTTTSTTTTETPLRLRNSTLKLAKHKLYQKQQQPTQDHGHSANLSDSTSHHESSSPSHHHHNHHDKPTASSTVIKQHWEVKSLLNVTQDYPLASSRIICGYVWPVMAFVTLFTNLMIVFVLTQRDMRTPTNVVLTAIAIADIVPIVVPVPWFVYLFAMGNEKLVLYPPTACYVYQHSTRSISEIFYFVSTWLNVLLAIQDYLTACWPKLAKKYCQIKFVIYEIIFLTLLAFLINLPQALKLVFKSVKFYYNGQITFGCKAAQARWFKDLIGEYAALYDDIFTAIIVVFVDGGPAIALITLTALLIKQLQRQRIQGHLLMEQARTASKRRRERHRQQEYESSARVMIFVLVAFLAVKIPFATTYTLMIIQSRFEIHFVENLNDFQKAITIVDLVFVLSYPLNFTIFCCCSKKFRHKCVQLLGECNRNTNAVKARWMSRISDSFHGSIESSESLNHHHHHRNRIYSIQQQNKKNDLNSNTVEVLASIKDKLKFDSSSYLYKNFNENNNNISINTNNLGYDYNGNIYNQQTRVEIIPSEQQQQQQLLVQSDDLSKTTTCDETTNLVPKNNYNKSLELDSELKALLEDGSICIECIARYEKMKREHLECRERRQSTDSAGINSCPPPPPPLVSCPYQLPHIVTTRCESIRDSSNGDSENGDGSAAKKTTECLNKYIKQHKQIAKKGEEVNNNGSRETRGENQEEASKGADEGEDKKQYLGEFNSYNGGWLASSTKEQENNKKHLMRSTTSRRNIASLMPRVSSDPGADYMNQASQQAFTTRNSDVGLSGGSINKSKHDVSSIEDKERQRKLSKSSYREENFSSDTDEDSETNSRRHSKNDRRNLSLIKMNMKQRSLSMSNSKLSALPNATGLLADILKTTLLTTSQSSVNHQQPSSDSLQHSGKGRRRGKGLVSSAPAK